MATQPSKIILQGCRVLKLMADMGPRVPRTVTSLVAQGNGELSADQVESVLLAFEQVGIVTRQGTPETGTLFLLGAFHLQLAMQELDGMLADAAYLNAALKKATKLKNLKALLEP